MQIHPGNCPQEYTACLSQQTGHRETSNLRKISLLHDWVFYSVDYPELSFPLCLPRGPSHCVIFHEELSQKEENFKPTLWSPFQRPRRRCDFFQGRVCMSQILPSMAGEFGFGFLLNPTLELEALVASTVFPVKCWGPGDLAIGLDWSLAPVGLTLAFPPSSGDRLAPSSSHALSLSWWHLRNI